MNGERDSAPGTHRPRRNFRELLRRGALGVLTVLLSPLLMLLAGILLLLNFAERVLHVRSKPVPSGAPGPSGLASLIILNWNGKDLLAQGLPSVIEAVRQDGRAHEILVVDNGSNDGSPEFLRESFPEVRILELPQNLGFAAGNNAGVRAAGHDIVVLLNNDMVVDHGFLRPLLESFEEDTFAVSCQIRNQDPSVLRQETGRTMAVFRRGMIDFSHREVGEISRPCTPAFWAGGGSSAFHRQKFLALGGFQEVFSPAYVEDADLSFQAWQAGWSVLFAPRSIVYHKHRASTSRRFSAAELDRLVQRNQILFLWKNIRGWRLLLSHCAFLPWNCYRLARDHGPAVWRALPEALARLPRLQAARMHQRFHQVRRDAEIFRLFKAPAAYFGRRPSTATTVRSDSRFPRVLWVTAYLPHIGRHAGAGRMMHLLRRIAVRYRVTLLSLIEQEEDSRHVAGLESLCERVITIPRIPPRRWQIFPYEPFQAFLIPAMETALQGCLENHEFGLIQLEYTQMGLYARRHFGIPTLLTKHEVDFAACARRARLESNPARKLLWFYRYLQVLDREIKLQREVDAAICMTEPDLRELIKFDASTPVHVVNTGVDLDYFSPPAQPEAAPRLVYVGAFQHLPNVEAMHFFCKQVLPRLRARVPGVELLIVGTNPPASLLALESIPGVKVTGSVPDIRPYMAAASVYIVPLRLGVGIRGKILEAWGMALPVVATRVACAGLRYSDGKNIMVADSADEFAARVVMLLQDPVLRVRMGREGRRVAEQFYGWDAIADQLMVLYEDYLNIPKGHRAGSRG